MKPSCKQGRKALVVVFDSTASALCFADAAKAAGLRGRLFPVPRSLSAGCGIAWQDEPDAQPSTEAILHDEGIDDARCVVMAL